jgi:hypothetical protein
VKNNADFELDLSNYKQINHLAARSRPVVKLGYKLHAQSVGLGLSRTAFEGARLTYSSVSCSSLRGLNKYGCKIKSHIAYFRVHSRAVASYFALSVLYWLAMSGTRGSSGLASVNRELIESKTLETVRAGDH